VIIGWMYNRSGRCLPVAWAANIGLLLMASIVTVQLFQFALVVGLFLLVAAVILMIDGAETRSG
jgi:hypothetical protein